MLPYLLSIQDICTLFLSKLPCDKHLYTDSFSKLRLCPLARFPEMELLGKRMYILFLTLGTHCLVALIEDFLKSTMTSKCQTQ